MMRRLKPIVIPSILVLLAGFVLGQHWTAASGLESAQAKPAVAAAAPQQSGGSTGILRQMSDAFAEIAERANPSVVTVFTKQVVKTRGRNQNPLGNPFRFFSPRAPDGESVRQGLGSGVIVAADGIILTNNHVIAGADEINVRLTGDRDYKAELVGTDPQSDVAVLRIDARNLPAIRFGDSDRLRVGEWVLAIGSPFGERLAHTITAGIVSAKGRFDLNLARYEDYIQTDAAINPGNSGGALVNLDGELVGINAAIASRSGGYQGVGFAIPVKMVKRVMESLLEHGEVVRGWLGVWMNPEDIDGDMAEALGLPDANGVLVTKLEPDSPAENAGVQEGDVVRSIDGHRVENNRALRNRTADIPPGTRVPLAVYRDGSPKTLSVVIEKLDPDKLASAAPGGRGGRDRGGQEELLGMAVEPPTPNLLRRFGLDREQAGVIVVDVESTGVAGQAGVRPGDIIRQVNRHVIRGMGDFRDAMAGLQPGDALAMRLLRDGGTLFVSMRIPRER